MNITFSVLNKLVFELIGIQEKIDQGTLPKNDHIKGATERVYLELDLQQEAALAMNLLFEAKMDEHSYTLSEGSCRDLMHIRWYLSEGK